MADIETSTIHYDIEAEVKGTKKIEQLAEAFETTGNAAEDAGKAAKAAGEEIANSTTKASKAIENVSDIMRKSKAGWLKDIAESKESKLQSMISSGKFDKGAVARQALATRKAWDQYFSERGITGKNEYPVSNAMTPEQAKAVAEQTSQLDLLKQKADAAAERYTELFNKGASATALANALKTLKNAQEEYNSALQKAYSNQNAQLVNVVTPEQANEFANSVSKITLLSSELQQANEKLAQSIQNKLLGDSSIQNEQRITSGIAKVQSIQSKLEKAMQSTASFQYAEGLKQIGHEAEANSPALEKFARAAEEVNTSTSADTAKQSSIDPSKVQTALDNLFANTASAATQARSAVSGFMDSLGQRAMGNVDRFVGGLKNIISSFKRIAFYRFIRSVIRSITDGFKEGVNNLYQWSKLLGGEFAKSMDTIATSSLYMKNSLGAMVAPLINALAPAVDFLIDKFVALLNVINQVLALFTGAATWTKAKKYPTEYAKAVTGGAGKAADALHKLGLAQIDELTILDKNHGDKNSGGGGASGLDYGSMFETEKLGGGIWDKIKEAIDKGDWRGAGKILAERLNEIVAGLDTRKWGREIGTKINNGLEFAYGFLKYTNFKQIGSKIADFINGGFENINFNTAGRLVARKLTALFDTIIGFVTTIDWGLVASKISDYFIGKLDEFSEWMEGIDWNDLGQQIQTKITDAISNVKWAELANSILRFFDNAVNAVLQFGIGLVFPLNEPEFEDKSKWGWKEWAEHIIACIAPAASAIAGFAVGGIPGALIGLTIGLGVKFLLDTDLKSKTDNYGKSLNETIGKHTKAAETEMGRAGKSIEKTTDTTWGNVSSKVITKLDSTNTTVGKKTTSIEKATAGSWGRILTTTSTKWGEIEKAVSGSLTNTNTSAKTKTTDIGTTVGNAWSSINTTTDSKWKAISGTIGTWIEEIKKKFNFSWSLPKLQLPSMPSPHFSWSTGIAGIPIPKFDGWWAQGGFPQEGSLFIAREPGNPEMVGSIGGHTAVANNDQIVEAVSQGVFEAVREAMGSGNQSVNVYLDGKQISGTVVQNINSETRRTGNSPLLSY